MSFHFIWLLTCLLVFEMFASQSDITFSTGTLLKY